MEVSGEYFSSTRVSSQRFIVLCYFSTNSDLLPVLKEERALLFILIITITIFQSVHHTTEENLLSLRS